jgi:hypothetical protein
MAVALGGRKSAALGKVRIQVRSEKYEYNFNSELSELHDFGKVRIGFH